METDTRLVFASIRAIGGVRIGASLGKGTGNGSYGSHIAFAKSTLRPQRSGAKSKGFRRLAVWRRHTNC